MPSAPSARWRATRDLTVDRPGSAPLEFAAGEKCVGAPAGWPPKPVVDLGWVVPVEPQTDEKGK